MTALSDEIDAMIAEHGGRVRDALNIAMAQRDALRAELADVRAQWQADVGSAIARAQTAEARATTTERQLADACEARDVALIRARTAEARAEQYENGRWHSYETVQAIVKEREELRAEVCRLVELIKDAADGVGYAVTFGNMLVKGETIDNFGDPDAVLYLLGEAKAIEDKLRAALRESNDEQH